MVDQVCSGAESGLQKALVAAASLITVTPWEDTAIVRPVTITLIGSSGLQSTTPTLTELGHR